MSGTGILNRGFGLFLSFLAVGALLCEAQAPAKPLLIRGKVLDSNRAAIAGSRAHAKGSQSAFSTVTDSNGDFALGLPPDSYTFTVTADGFAAVSRTVTVKPGASESLEI